MRKAWRCFPSPLNPIRYLIPSVKSPWYASLHSDTAGNLHAVPKTTIRLRGYQDECIQSILSHLSKGHKRLGVSLATGSGKTVIFTQLVGHVQPARQHATRSLILVHRRELVEQAARHCADAYPNQSIDIEMGNLHASGTADITIASVQSITSNNRLMKFDPELFKLIIVDEAHHIVASSYMKTLMHFGLLGSANSSHSPALVGVSATLSRLDGLRLSDAIDHIVYHKDYIDMIGEKWLSDVIFTTVESKANISGVKKGPTGDFQTGSLSKAVNTEKSNEITFKAWLARASERKSTLVFCVDLQHIADLSAVFRKNDIEVHSVTGSTPNQVRSKRLDAFKNGDYPVLLNCGVFTEGTDIPNIDCILLARPTKSRNLLVQMIGRGMRLHPGKTDCHVIDMVASLDVGVVTTPTLFGLDPTELVKEASIIDLKTLRERREQESLTEAQAEKLAAKSITGSSDPHRTITFTDYESIYDLIDDTSGERHIRRISQLAWVLTGENRYTLSTQSGDYITIEQNESSGTEYHVLYTARLPRNATKSKSPYMRPREIAQSESFSSAVHAADTFASEKFLWRFISHSQRWRQTPATDGQIAFLNKFRDMDDQLTSDDLTKGKATDSITKLKFGARGRFSKLEAVRKKRARHGAEMDLVTRMRQRERVATGKTIDTY